MKRPNKEVKERGKYLTPTANRKTGGCDQQMDRAGINQKGQARKYVKRSEVRKKKPAAS